MHIVLGKKTYSVSFNQYTNCSKDIVYDDSTDSYMSIENGFCFITVDQIDEVMKFGEDIKSMMYVGRLIDISENCTE